MKEKFKISAACLSGVMLALLMSCADNVHDEPADAFGQFKIYPIVNQPGSRTVSRPDDGFTALKFGTGDKCGFFSERGNMGSGNAGFVNQMMSYDNGAFVAGGDMKVDINNTGRTFIYYPYSNRPNGEQDIRNDQLGNYHGEVKDILVAYNAGYVDDYWDPVTGTKVSGYAAVFDHLFSMFIIIGGDGFENFHKRSVSVTMNRPVRTVRFPETETPDGKYLREVEFPEESNPKYSEFTGHWDKYVIGTEKKDAYYIIIPTGDNKIKVKSLNITDDKGYNHNIDLTGYGYIPGGNKFPLSLTLEDQKPVIYPHEITPWTGVDITVTEEKGISNYVRFNDWLRVYNSKSMSEDERRTELKKYGDETVVKNEETGEERSRYWHFYITNDIDLSELPGGSFVNTLTDVLDGCGHTLTGINISAPFINEMKGEHALLTNIVIDGMTIMSESTEPIGALVKNFAAGELRLCTVTSLKLDTNGEAGAIAGTVANETDVKVSNCHFSGVMYGTGTESKIIGVGTLPGDFKKETDVSNLMFGQKQQVVN